MVTHIFSDFSFEPTEYLPKLEEVINLWTHFISLKERDIVIHQFRHLFEHILSSMDQEGIYWGTRAELSKSTNLTPYVIRKLLGASHSYNLTFRRYGMIVVNTKAFTAAGLENRKENFLS